MTTDDTITITGDHIPSVTPGYRLQFEQAQDTWVLLYPEGMVKLNQSASEILQRCDGKRTVAEVVTQLEKDFEQSGLENDVLGFLAVASEQKWIVIKNAG